MSEKLFKTDKDLKDAIQAYLDEIEGKEKKPTITGLAYHLGFADRRSFYDYENNPEHSYTIKRARTYIESTYEEQLRGNNVTGAIFALKNFGWRDKQELEHTGADGNPIENKWTVEIVDTRKD
jgi:hypothetical protein